MFTFCLKMWILLKCKEIWSLSEPLVVIQWPRSTSPSTVRWVKVWLGEGYRLVCSFVSSYASHVFERNPYSVLCRLKWTVLQMASVAQLRARSVVVWLAIPKSDAWHFGPMIWAASTSKVLATKMLRQTGKLQVLMEDTSLLLQTLNQLGFYDFSIYIWDMKNESCKLQVGPTSKEIPGTQLGFKPAKPIRSRI